MMIVNDGLPFLVNSSIIEYDIKRGNTSVMRHFNMFPKEMLDELDAMPKKQRNVNVGLLQRNDKAFAHNLEAGFDKVVKEFIEINGLDQDVDILAIRRDAVFVVNKPIKVTSIGDSIKFVKKNTYHASLQIGPRLEFYFGDNGTEIKNFIQADKDEDGVLERLKPGMISFLEEFVSVAESSNMNRLMVYEWLRHFCEYYKDRALDVEYYREFTRDALFKVILDDGPSYLDFVPDEMIDDLDISYNYMNIIVPLLQILV